jgi:hypothetical protein
LIDPEVPREGVFAQRRDRDRPKRHGQDGSEARQGALCRRRGQGGPGKNETDRRVDLHRGPVRQGPFHDLEIGGPPQKDQTAGDRGQQADPPR